MVPGMASWREEVAALLEGPQNTGEIRAAPVLQKTRRYSDLPIDLADGVERLNRTPSSRFRGDSNRWARVVDDAHRLALEGWAGKALALGWSPHDAFGIGRRDANDFAGLAVWLDGRSVVVLDGQRAMARIDRGWAYFERGSWGHGRDAEADPVMLWQFGRE